MSQLLHRMFFDNPEIPLYVYLFCQGIPEYVQAREEYYALVQELEAAMGRQWYFTFEARLNQYWAWENRAYYLFGLNLGGKFWRDFRGRGKGGASGRPRPTKYGNGSAGGHMGPPLRRIPHRERWLGKVRRRCGIAEAAIFAYPGPSGPGGIASNHSDFARRKSCWTFQERVSRNGVRGKATMSTKCSSEPSPAAFCLLCRRGQSRSPPAGGETPPAEQLTLS